MRKRKLRVVERRHIEIFLFILFLKVLGHLQSLHVEYENMTSPFGRGTLAT